jgi:hypothetical protein
VPEFPINPGDAGDESVGLDRAKNRPCVRIDLMDLAIAILPHPERAFGPRQPRVSAAAGRRDGCEHTAGLWIDLLNAILGELIEVLAVEGGARVRRGIERTQRLPARRIQRVQLVSRREPDLLTVICHPMYMADARKGAILTNDFGG